MAEQQVGVFVEQAPSDGHWFMGLMFAEGNMLVKVGLCQAENAEETVNALVTQLRMAKGDLKRNASGLVVAQEVPNGLRKS